MKSTQPPIFAWQQPSWPHWKYDAEAIADVLMNARQQQAMVISKAQAIGLTNDYLPPVINRIWVDEVMATAAIEGQQLNLDQVRSSVMRKFGIEAGHSVKHVDGLVDVMFDATEHFDQKLNI